MNHWSGNIMKIPNTSEKKLHEIKFKIICTALWSLTLFFVPMAFFHPETDQFEFEIFQLFLHQRNMLCLIWKWIVGNKIKMGNQDQHECNAHRRYLIFYSFLTVLLHSSRTRSIVITIILAVALKLAVGHTNAKQTMPYHLHQNRWWSNRRQHKKSEEENFKIKNATTKTHDIRSPGISIQLYLLFEFTCWTDGE